MSPFRPPYFPTALDPAGSFFENRPKDARLDSGDAQFVDAIHTDADFAGLWQQLGHLDFYPNGGATQPKGCKDFIGGEISFTFPVSDMRAEFEHSIFFFISWRLICRLG